MFQRINALFVAVGVAIVLDALWVLAQPAVGAQLEFSTYFGGAGLETVTAVRVDSNGNRYVAGSTRSTDLPTRRSLFPPPAFPGGEVGFLIKLRADGAIVYATYLARPVAALAVDSGGNALVADNLAAGSRFTGPLGDVVISKIDTNGLEMLYSVRLAGSRLEQAAALAVDHTGAVVVTGHTNSPDFPLVNAIQLTVQTSGRALTDKSAFITKLDALGRIMFSTGWGGTGEDAGMAIAVDRALDIYVTGTTSSPDFTTNAGAFQRVLASATCRSNSLPCTDAFVTKLSPDGQTIVYSTLFGGTNGEPRAGTRGRSSWPCAFCRSHRISRSAAATRDPDLV